ncbi:MAG TPA: hypothetical protein V6C81_11295 [Planktothrix sp.]|jgi:hypothetical protein
MKTLTRVVVCFDEAITQKAKDLDREFHFHPHVSLEAVLSKISEALEKAQSPFALSRPGMSDDFILEAISWLHGGLFIIANHRSAISTAQASEKRSPIDSSLLRRVNAVWLAADRIVAQLVSTSKARYRDLEKELTSKEISQLIVLELEILKDSVHLISWRRKHAQTLRRIAAAMLESARTEEATATALSAAR